MYEHQSVLSPTGAQLSLWTCPVSGTAKGVVQICHGLGEHAERYARFAEALSVAGYAVYAEDHRGHGKTTAPDAPAGFFARAEGWNQVLADKAFINIFMSNTRICRSFYLVTRWAELLLFPMHCAGRNRSMPLRSGMPQQTPTHSIPYSTGF
jgi:hypothetical protein